MRKTVMTALMGLLMTCVGTNAWADATPGNDADSLTITITPNVDRGVDIDTGSVTLNLGTVDLLDSAQTVTPATVTILGNVAAQELDVSGAIASVGTPWTFDATPSTDTLLGATDELAMFVLFSTTGLSLAPDGDDFGTDDASFTGSARAGASGGTGLKFEKTGTGAQDMDDLAPSDTQHLWLFLRLPSTTTGSDDQLVTMTLTAVDAS